MHISLHTGHKTDLTDRPSPPGGTIGISPSSEALIYDRCVGCPDENGDLQVSSSQTEDDDFGGGAWAAMKAEIGLDERNPSCFLHSYSIVMVLRKVSCHNLHTRHAFNGMVPGSFPAEAPVRFYIGQDIFYNYLPIIIQTMSPLDVFWYCKTKWWRCTGGDL